MGDYYCLLGGWHFQTKRVTIESLDSVFVLEDKCFKIDLIRKKTQRERERGKWSTCEKRCSGQKDRNKKQKERIEEESQDKSIVLIRNLLTFHRIPSN